MNKFKKILVPLDGSKNSKRALLDAVFLAKFTGASITGIYIIHSESESHSFLDILKPLSSIDEKGSFGKQLTEANMIMGDANEECKKNNVVFNGIATQGNSGFKIVKFAEDKDFDIIVIGMTGKGHAGELILGSVSYFVVHKSKIPVLVIK